MKKITYLLGLLFLAVSFASCSDSDDDIKVTKESVVGYWYEYSKIYWNEVDEEKTYGEIDYHEGDDCRYYFYDDGTGDSREYDNKWYIDPFTWGLSGNKIIVSWNNGGETDFTIKSLTNSTMIIEEVLRTYSDGNRKGKDVTYRKVGY